MNVVSVPPSRPTARVTARMAFACGLLFLVIDADPALAEQRRVLALYAARRDSPGLMVVDQVLQRMLGHSLGPTLDYYTEYLDVARLPDPDNAEALRAYLKHKYGRLRFDVVIATSNAAVDFVERYRVDLFPGVPLVFSGVTGVRAGPNATGHVYAIDVAGTLDLALQLQPSTRQVFVVSGASSYDRYYEDLARTQLRPFENRVAITYLSGLLMSDLLERLAALPANSIVYVTAMAEDGAGQRFMPLDAFDRMTATANRPVYAWITTAIDHGVVGGRFLSLELAAAQLGELTLRVLRGEKPDSIAVEEIHPIVTELDWRQLRRWGISEARVPAGANVRFREPGLWDRYRTYIIGTVAVVLLQTVLIAGLLVQRVRRQRVERDLRDSYQQNLDLAGRLITAQEAERSRIGRDLHDDVCQRLAGLAIMLSGLKQRLKGSTPQPDVEEALTTLQERTSTLAIDVRNLSHDLHPSVLEHAGLIPVLKAHCDEFAQQHKIDVTFGADGGMGPVDGDAALCVYRVTQEALANTAKHARASAVRVRLTQTAEAIELEIVDDGIGFESGRQTPSGLGLRSIDERVRFNKGAARVESHPGQGTSVLVRIPVSRAVTGELVSRS